MSKLAREAVEEGCVYIFRARNEPWTKIGYTTGDPQTRLAKMQSDCPHALEVFAIIHTDDVMRLEAELHNRFEFCRLHGEWFAMPEYELKRTIEEMTDPYSGEE